MNSNPTISTFSSARKILKNRRVEASAPCRIDSGGTWDIRSMALPMEAIEPVTLNIALSLRTRVVLLPFEDGMVKVSSEGFPETGAHDFRTLPFDSPFGLFYRSPLLFWFPWARSPDCLGFSFQGCARRIQHSARGSHQGSSRNSPSWPAEPPCRERTSSIWRTIWRMP